MDDYNQHFKIKTPNFRVKKVNLEDGEEKETVAYRLSRKKNYFYLISKFLFLWIKGLTVVGQKGEPGPPVEFSREMKESLKGDKLSS